MRVAVDVAPLLAPATGVATVTRGLIDALAAGGGSDEIVAYALSGRGGPAEVTPSLPGAIAIGRRTALPMPAAILNRAWAVSDFPPVELWTGRVDVVHGTNFVVPPSRRRRAGRVVTVHDLTCLRYPAWCTRATLRYPALLRRGIAGGAFVHTPSEAVRAEVVELLGAPAERVRVIANGFDPASVGRGDVCAGQRLAGAGRYVLALGTVEPRKGFDSLVRAAATIDAHVVIAGADGWGGAPEAVEEARRSLPDPTRVRRLGRVVDTARADLLAGAAAVAVPSIYEGFGYPMLEAMAAGIPVVATAVPALSEVSGAAALLVPPGDASALADALQRVLDDDGGIAGQLREAGRRRCTEFPWSTSAAAMRALYADAAAEAAR